FFAAALSRLVISADLNLISSSVPGVGEPCGGMAPTPSLRITFSQISGWVAGSSRLAVSNASGAPAGIRALTLWQVTQYLVILARLGRGLCCDVVEGCFWGFSPPL